MFILVHHSITDSEAFFSLAEKVAQTPQGITLHQGMPVREGNKAVCLWEAESIDAVQSHLEPIIGAYSTNVYLEIDETKATGLPR